MTSGGRQGGKSGWRVLIVGTGGQGVLTAARLLCDLFVDRGHDVVSGQLHGMAQRGGSVQSSVLIDCGSSPMIAAGRADFVLGFEPVETVRALPFMSSRTVVYMNTNPVIPYTVGQQWVLTKGKVEYPCVDELRETIEAVTPHLYSFDATRFAEVSGSSTTLNMIMLGCLLGSGSFPYAPDDLCSALTGRLPPASADANRKAFSKGVELGKTFRRSECYS